MESFQKTPNDPNLKVLFHSPSFKCIPKHFEHLSNVLEILLIERRVPAVFGDLENQNYSFNKGIINQGPGIKSLRGKHQNHPAVLSMYVYAVKNEVVSVISFSLFSQGAFPRDFFSETFNKKGFFFKKSQRNFSSLVLQYK